MVLTLGCAERALKHNSTATHIFHFTLLVKLGFSLLLATAAYSRIFSTDGYRYFDEIQMIAESPWLWNPFTGAGPGYKDSAKMGMQYFYGWILFFLGGSSLSAVIALNNLFAGVTSLIAFDICRQITPDRLVQWVVLFVVGVHPEVIFWAARVTREPFAIFLVVLSVWLLCKLMDGIKLRYLMLLVLTSVYISLVRVQLLFVPAVGLGFLAIFRFGRSPLSWAGILAVAISWDFFYRLLEAQLARSVGKKLLKFLSFDPWFWVDKYDSFFGQIAGVLSLTTKGGYGLVGALLVPSSLWTFGFFLVGSMLVFALAANRLKACFVIFMTVVFWVALAMHGAENIRFRSEVAPLAIIIATMGFVFSVRMYWFRLRPWWMSVLSGLDKKIHSRKMKST